jgi:hypothetical protein
MQKAAAAQLYFGFRNSPGALAIGDAELLTTTLCDEPASLIDQLGDLSNGGRECTPLPFQRAEVV